MMLTTLRKQKGWSMSELARRTGMGQPTIGQIESGRLIPYESQLIKLADALGLLPGEHHKLMENGNQLARYTTEELVEELARRGIR
jgi:transcriptional regulator with XRE-family HTH domain